MARNAFWAEILFLSEFHNFGEFWIFAKMTIIGENIICRIAALLPDEAHGRYKGDKRIEQYAKKNEL